MFIRGTAVRSGATNASFPFGRLRARINRPASYIIRQALKWVGGEFLRALLNYVYDKES